MTAVLSPCCDAPLFRVMGHAPRPDWGGVCACERCGQVYRADGEPEGRWQFPMHDQHGRTLRPLRTPRPITGGRP